MAETSITIDGVTIVVDSGLQRLPKFEPASGLTRLETVRVSKASADQRAGRAGRTAPGIAIRLWRKEQTAALPDFTPPEILEADLSGLVLDAAEFGVADLGALRFLDAPPVPALNEARILLRDLDALDETGRLTATGKSMRKLALPVRLAHMAVKADDAAQAAELAVLLSERGLGGNDADLDLRWANFRRDRSPNANAARSLARQIASNFSKSNSEPVSAGELLLLAYPDHAAKARGRPGQFLLASGRGAELDPAHPLAAKPWIVVADMQGTADRMRILAAAEISEEAVLDVLSAKVATEETVSFDTAKRALRRRRIVRLGAITIQEQMLAAPTGEAADAAMIEAVRAHGLGVIDWPKEALVLRKRLAWLRKGLGEPWPDVGDDALLNRLDEWLRPWLNGDQRASKIARSLLGGRAARACAL